MGLTGARGATEASAQSAQSAQTPPAPPAPSLDGFRLEPDAEIEVVFGDAVAYRERVDRFYALHDQLDAARVAFGRASHACVQALAAAPGRSCPAAALAKPYADATRALADFRDIGARLEAEYQRIHELDVLGSSAGLTPDYRWQVNRTRGLYRAARRDLREMRAVMASQLAPELRARRCVLPADVGTAAAAPDPDAAGDGGATAAAPAAVDTAPPATFFVDNRRCRRPVSLVLAGAPLGTVAASTLAVFQAPAGRHEMCLLAAPTGPDQDGGGGQTTGDGADGPATGAGDGGPATGGPRCGDRGTVRSAYVHDGWSIKVDCR